MLDSKYSSTRLRKRINAVLNRASQIKFGINDYDAHLIEVVSQNLSDLGQDPTNDRKWIEMARAVIDSHQADGHLSDQEHQFILTGRKA